jgi:hypothetical protein
MIGGGTLSVHVKAVEVHASALVYITRVARRHTVYVRANQQLMGA